MSFKNVSSSLPSFSTPMRTAAALFAAAALAAASAGASQSSLPAGAEDAMDRLNASPRHTEWVEIESHGDRIDAYVVYPERSDNAPVVVVLHEIYGLNDWARAVADQVAAEGFIAIAPDMLSGKGPDGAGSTAVDQQGAVNLMRTLQPDEITRRIDMSVEYATSLPAATQSFGIMGFCWGGSTSFRYATTRADLGASVVYYGSSPDAQALGSIEAPVMGFYGGDDQRVNATIDPAKAEMDRLGKRYEANIYEGAGHGFLRAQTDREGANMAASEQAWPATIRFLKAELEGS
jgi:carboxymethylenebutenolidase